MIDFCKYKRNVRRMICWLHTAALLKLPCSSEPSAKPQSSLPSHTWLAGRHFPLAH